MLTSVLRFIGIVVLTTVTLVGTLAILGPILQDTTTVTEHRVAAGPPNTYAVTIENDLPHAIKLRVWDWTDYTTTLQVIDPVQPLEVVAVTVNQGAGVYAFSGTRKQVPPGYQASSIDTLVNEDDLIDWGFHVRLFQDYGKSSIWPLDPRDLPDLPTPCPPGDPTCPTACPEEELGTPCPTP